MPVNSVHYSTICIVKQVGRKFYAKSEWVSSAVVEIYTTIGKLRNSIVVDTWVISIECQVIECLSIPILIGAAEKGQVMWFVFTTEKRGNVCNGRNGAFFGGKRLYSGVDFRLW